MVMLLIYLAIALGVSFLCSVLEAVLLSITPGFAAMQGSRGDAFGRRLESFKRDIDRPLAAILTLNTFAHTIGAAGVGAQAQAIWGEATLTIVSAVVTILILVLSEIIPKTLGAVYWRQLARPSVAVVSVLVWLLLPFVWLSQLLTSLLRRGGATRSVLSRSDIGNLLDVGLRDGILRQSEHSILRNMVGLSGILVRDLMVPRERIIACEAGQPIAALRADLPAWHTSRIPIYRGELDRVIGYVLKDEVLAANLAGRGAEPLANLRRDILTVRADCPLPELYSQLVERSEHIAVVMEEGRSIVGLLTMEDLIEAILGLQIIDESDPERDRDEQQKWLADRRRRQGTPLAGPPHPPLESAPRGDAMHS